MEGRLVMLTNVGFDGTIATLTLGAANTDLFVTNSSGRFDIRLMPPRTSISTAKPCRVSPIPLSATWIRTSRETPTRIRSIA